MKGLRAVVIALIAAANAFGQSPKVVPQPKDKVVNKFEAHNEVALRSLLRLGAETGTPLGLIQNGEQLCKAKVDISVEGESIASIADQLTGPIGYTWSVEDGVLVIHPQTIPLGVQQLLDTLIPRFGAPRTTLAGLGVFLTIDVRAVFRPDLGSAGSISRSPDAFLVGPIQVNNVTVRKALNTIVKLGIGGQWILRPLPEDFRKAPDTKLFDIVDYASNPMQTVEGLTCDPPPPVKLNAQP
jgi:hypothetical protein